MPVGALRRFSQSVRQIRNAIQVIIPPMPQSEEVFAGKRANLAAVVNELHGGTGPELLGVAEVEGDKVSGSGMEAQGESA